MQPGTMAPLLRPPITPALVVAACLVLPHAGHYYASVIGSSDLASGAPPPTPLQFHPEAPSQAMLTTFHQKGFSLDAPSGNYLAPKVFSKVKVESLVPVLINGRYVSDLRGHPIFLRTSIRDRLLKADDALFKAKQKHIVINYGFRSNALQAELFTKINGTGKVAEVGRSFHEAGMALDLSNWRDSQRYMIEAGFVGGCYGIEEDLVHYSVDEITKASNMDAFKRCTLKEIPADILTGTKKVGQAGKTAIKKVTGK
jgi:hypothetical protein